jgi:nicotinamide riboside transporter PnuC
VNVVQPGQLPAKLVLLLFGVATVAIWGRLLWKVWEKRRELPPWVRIKAVAGCSFLVTVGAVLVAVAVVGLVERPCEP